MAISSVSGSIPTHVPHQVPAPPKAKQDDESTESSATKAREAHAAKQAQSGPQRSGRPQSSSAVDIEA